MKLTSLESRTKQPFVPVDFDRRLQVLINNDAQPYSLFLRVVAIKDILDVSVSVWEKF
ncbi:hypothetical protein WBG78_02345 [Chryseolinea sp. T2]|uniref:hypothetical protein n=1 Tax=Chryseolinea sp. T2 TaxID=3129255 RepID=UPI0030788550